MNPPSPVPPDPALAALLSQAEDANPPSIDQPAADQPTSSPPTPRTGPGPILPDALSPTGGRGPLSGQDWGGYQIGDLVGRGGMGEVYRAVQRSVGRVVALKVLPAGDADPERRARFAAEARAAARLHSPHVVAVHDSGEHEGHLWLAMEFVAGRSLADELRQRRQEGRRFTPIEAIDLILQAARGLAVAHGERLVHRDIKPGNLLLDAGGVLKVADFGLVRFLDERALTVTGTMLGTPLYIAPEQGRGQATDARGDVYSLGVVLYELLTMAPPFTGRDAEEVVSRHNFTEPELPSARNPDVPLDLQAVCLKCLQKAPERRFADAGELATDLERLRAGLAPLVAVFGPGIPTTGAEEALRRLAGWRRRWWPVLGGAAGLALAIAGGWWWWDARKAETAQVRERLAPLAQAAPPPATAADDLAVLARLAGAHDPQVAQGRAKLAAIAAVSARLDGHAALTEADPAQRAAWAAALADLVELVGPGDPRLDRHRAALAAAVEQVAALRARLASRLGTEDPIAPAAGAAVQDDLARLARLAGPEDADLRRWQAAIAHGAAAVADDRQALARLERAGPLRVDELPALAAAHARLLRLAPGSPGLDGQGRAIAAAQEAIAARRALLDRLLAQRDAGPATRSELAASLAWLEARAALPEIPARRARDLLATVERELAGLRARLAVLDAPRPLPEGLDRVLARYEALVGLQDAGATAWRRRFEAVRLLEARLAPLDRALSEPATAAADLAALVQLVGAGDPHVVAWQGKLTAIGELRTRLAVLDRAEPPPAWAAGELDRLAAQVGGEDAAVRRWRARLAELAALAAGFVAWPSLRVIDPEALASARAQVARWRALAGDPALAAAADARLAALAGPPAPPWAAAHGHDPYGPWCELRVDGAVQRLRWLPPGTYPVGSAADDEGREPGETPAMVTVGGLWVADSECSQALWQAVVGTRPARHRDPAAPVEQVSRRDADAFCARLGARLPGCAARLPAEAEWEAAVRAGEPGPWAGLAPAQAAAVVVHAGGAPGHAAPAGQGRPNRLGLHEGAGNLWEWCRDDWGPAPGDGPAAPRILGSGTGTVRGGSWADPLALCRPASRAPLDAAARSPCVGFRFVVEP